MRISGTSHLTSTLERNMFGNSVLYLLPAIIPCEFSRAAVRREKESLGKVKRAIKGELRVLFALFAPQVQGCQIARLLQTVIIPPQPPRLMKSLAIRWPS